MNASVDYRGILNPSAKLQGRASQVLADLAGRTLWHTLFDNTPSLAQALGDDGSVRALLGFLEDCERHDISLNWEMALIFLEWLGGQQARYTGDDKAYVLECMSAAAAAWAGEITDVGGYRMILVCIRSELAVGAIRPLTVDSGSRVFCLQLDLQLQLGARFVYAVSDRSDQWPIDGWRAVRTFNH